MDELSKPRWNSLDPKRIWKALVCVALTLTVLAFWYRFYVDEVAPYSLLTSEYSSDEYYAGCNVAGIILHGDLDTYAVSAPETGESWNIVGSEDIVYWIKMAEEEPDVRAILLEIDSYGGYPVAAEEVTDALRGATKPTVAQIRGAGLSAAYWAATGADTIFASELSDVGSIGVTQSYVDASKYNETSGYTFNLLNTGKYKDMLNPEKSLTVEERALLMRDLQITHEAFIRAVAENRKLDINKVRALADGSSMLGEMALENGLIDKIGGTHEVEKYLEEVVGTEPEICW